MKTLTTILITVILLGCDDGERVPEKVKASSNTSYPVALLFTIDGCKVYRFFDQYEYVYLTTCPNTRAQSKFCRQEGKVRRCYKQLNEVIND